MKIVSANYRDRTAKECWLIRDEKQKPEEAKAYKSVVATGVLFKMSSKYEEGFGCSVVANCATAEAVESFDPPPSGIGLMFDVDHFLNKNDTTKRVRSCKKLFLGPDGSMIAEV